MSSVCPACGVAVVPGYVRCPRCHAGLPVARARRTTGDPGGTAVASRGFPISAVVVAVGVAAAIIVVFGARRATRPDASEPALPAPVEAIGASAAPRSVAPLAVPATEPPPGPAAQARRAAAAALQLEATLRRQRLWGRTEIVGPRIDVRSGSCADPAMAPAIAGDSAVLRDTGLTRLRCLAQSGAIVFERDL